MTTWDYYYVQSSKPVRRESPPEHGISFTLCVTRELKDPSLTSQTHTHRWKQERITSSTDGQRVKNGWAVTKPDTCGGRWLTTFPFADGDRAVHLESLYPPCLPRPSFYQAKSGGKEWSFALYIQFLIHRHQRIRRALPPWLTHCHPVSERAPVGTTKYFGWLVSITKSI